MTMLGGASNLETFYVYRSLHSDESWGALLGCSNVCNLPNIDFGMLIYARNERDAILRARELYEKIHKQDSDRDNVRRFAYAALRRAMEEETSDPDKAADKAMTYAIAMNKKFKNHFDNVGGEEVEQAKKEVEEERIIPELRELRATGS